MTSEENQVYNRANRPRDVVDEVTYERLDVDLVAVHKALIESPEVGQTKTRSFASRPFYRFALISATGYGRLRASIKSHFTTTRSEGSLHDIHA